jgi:hypothetical protein
LLPGWFGFLSFGQKNDLKRMTRTSRATRTVLGAENLRNWCQGAKGRFTCQFFI